jgi:hypothetical protein
MLAKTGKANTVHLYYLTMEEVMMEYLRTTRQTVFP